MLNLQEPLACPHLARATGGSWAQTLRPPWTAWVRPQGQEGHGPVLS